ncbi:MAG TPA: hypothetical protein VD962_09530 [Rubricoccaceae bacterium]|nr:hypothetical protein [Rubricoccaceae bacterium]
MLPASLPDDARLWLFAADRALSLEEQTALLDVLRPFFAGWTSHGRPVTGAAEVLEDRVVALGATLSGDLSGCGIDQMQHALDEGAARLGVAWLSPLDVAYRDGNGWHTVSRAAFRALAREGAVTPDTHVLDVTAATVGDLRANGVVRPAHAAWHGRAFGLALPAGA